MCQCLKISFHHPLHRNLGNKAVFTSDEGENEGPGFLPISIEQKKFYSLSTSGLEQELELEDGSKMENANIEGFINTKSGLILGVRFNPNELNPEYHRKIYKLNNGKTLKLISDDNRLRPDYRQMQNGFQEVSSNYSYFCTEKGIMKWNDSTQVLENIKELEEGSGCNGSQIRDEFYFITDYYEESLDLKFVEIGRFKSDGSMELIETGELDSN